MWLPVGLTLSAQLGSLRVLINTWTCGGSTTCPLCCCSSCWSSCWLCRSDIAPKWERKEGEQKDKWWWKWVKKKSMIDSHVHHYTSHILWLSGNTKKIKNKKLILCHVTPVTYVTSITPGKPRKLSAYKVLVSNDTISRWQFDIAPSSTPHFQVDLDSGTLDRNTYIYIALNGQSYLLAFTNG